MFPHSRIRHQLGSRLGNGAATLVPLFAAFWLSWLWPVAAALANDQAAGEAIYRSLCQSCHGPTGEGTPKHYPYALIGDRSIPELAEYIDKSMPEGEPEKCTGEEARHVAAYMYQAFYSPAAQSRLHPARLELARLTVRQYVQTVTDLIGSFRPPSAISDERGKGESGLRGEYFKTRRQRGNERVLERIDPVVKFDFGEESPDKEKIPEPVEFSIRWQGSVLAEETGEYEFILASENGARLWVNDVQKPLIDAGVRSGNDARRESIRLLAGRAYPLRLEFFKSKEAKEKRASISLLWKPPLGVDEVIPERCLTPRNAPESFVLQTPFPPDDRSSGYERGTSVSKAWDRATTDAALEIAGYLEAHLAELIGGGGEGERVEKCKRFCHSFVERALRRPLDADQKASFIDRWFQESSDPVVATKKVVIRVLKSPAFLYREPAGASAVPTDVPFDVASRLSFGLWDSLPDQTLVESAAAGRLQTRADIVREAERMLRDPRTRSKLHEFLMQWLKVDQLAEVAKDRTQFPDFDAALVADLRTSLNLFLDDAVWGESPDFRRLIVADELFVNGRLAKFYGLELPADAPFQKVRVDAEPRAGVLTHPFLLSAFAYTSTSSPIHRGVFLTRNILGRSLRQPPIAVAPLAPDLHADLTTRDRVILQTKPETCQSCHGMINPLGFALEQFDAVGRYRKEEVGKAIDASGAYRDRRGDWVKFAGIRELAAYLAQSDEARVAFVEQLFHYLVKQPIQAYGPETSTKLSRTFAESDFQVAKLMVEIMVVASDPAMTAPPTSSAK